MALLILFASLLLTFHVHGTSDSNFTSSSLSQAVIKSSCTATFYPDICYSTFSDISQKLETKKDVIELAIKKTKDTVLSNFHNIEKLKDNTNLTKRAKMALDDCLEMEDTTLEGLDKVLQDLREYPTKKSLRQYADDLKTIMSTTITNKETCLDELSYDATCKWLRKSIIQGEDRAGKMCSNILAMIKDMTDTDISNSPELNVGRKLKENKKGIIWPEWLSAGDRKLLGIFGETPNVIVSKDGKGKYKTVMAAVDAAPNKSTHRYVIKINAGVYQEYVEIPRNKPNIMFIGDGRDKTVITGNKSFGGGFTTTKSATVAVLGERFLARDMTFQNTAGAAGHQAVALRVTSDLCAFYKCGIDSYQDTLYVVSNRQFYVKCLIIGTIDFIFGNAAVVFQFCDIQARKPGPTQANMVTAHGRMDKNQETGIVIHKCIIQATSDLKPLQKNISTYLGRPWKQFARTVIMRSIITDVIRIEGWSPWEKDFALDTLYYREYRNHGAGSDTSKRVKWKGFGVIKDDNEAMPFTVPKFINGWSWLLSTGFPFWPGL